ncbi:hypothetical protein LCGC14_2444590 [marine sediment metagenome]|uniref:Uncharacterized protein n=1 Tax=marine sediment metagenome TaxID=412755 RepID=A0A0F9BI30_9ZZZZ
MRLKTIAVDEITIGKRHRKDMGDLLALADSIDTEGLLQPIGITKDSELVFGQRRLLAIRDILGWDRLQAVTIDVTSIAAGEYAENEIRKDFTLSERDAIRRTLEAEIGNRQGQRTDKELVGNSPQVEPGQKTREITAKQAGFRSTDEARAVRTVTDKGAPELVKAMDEGLAPSVAAKATELPKADQKRIAKADNPSAKARELLADEKTPHQQAAEDPERRWHASLHKIYVLMTSTRDLGGIKKLAGAWSVLGKKEWIAELNRIVGELQKWIQILEK